MTSSDNQFQSTEKEQYFSSQSLNRTILRHRAPVAIALVYYVWILYSAWSMSDLWSWNLEDGLIWSSGGFGMFFPIPIEPGMAAVITQAGIIDQVFYLVFIHSGIWILWIILGLLYIFSPYRLNVGVVKRKLGMKSVET